MIKSCLFAVLSTLFGKRQNGSENMALYSNEFLQMFVYFFLGSTAATFRTGDVMHLQCYLKTDC